MYSLQPLPQIYTRQLFVVNIKLQMEMKTLISYLRQQKVIITEYLLKNCKIDSNIASPWSYLNGYARPTYKIYCFQFHGLC